MIFNIDVENKTVSVEGIAPINKFIENLEKLIPKDDWKDWKIEFYKSLFYYVTNSPIINPYIPDYPIYEYEPTAISPFITNGEGQTLNSDLNPITVSSNIILVEFKDE